MTALAGPLHMLAVVLMVSGAAKIMSPAPAAAAMHDAGLPLPLRGRPVTGIGLGVSEASVGVVALAVPTWWAATALGVAYLSFAAFVLRLRSRDGNAGCGCFGSSSAPPGTAHLVLNLSAAAVALAAVIAGVPDVVDVFDEGVAVAVPYVALLAIGAGTLLAAPPLSAEIARIRSGDVPRSFSPVAGSSVTSRRRPTVEGRS